MSTKQQTKIGKFILESKRIFTIARKPTKKEYNMTLKICLIGLLIIGGLAFIIQLIATIIQGGNTAGA